MPNILKNESWKDVTEGSANTISVAITKHQNTYLRSLTPRTKSIKFHWNRQEA